MRYDRNIALVYLILNSFFAYSQTSVTLIGRIKFADSLGRLPIGIFDCLSDKIDFNFISINKNIDLTDVSINVQKIIQKTKTPGKIALLLDHPWYCDHAPVEFVPAESSIKIAYSMIEATKLPPQWVSIFNTKFDALLVPDSWLVEVYEKSGVKIPLFVLPHGLYLEDFLSRPVHKKNVDFVFGMVGRPFPWKNHELLIDAFIKEFGNQPHVTLKLHFSAGYIIPLIQKIQKAQIRNIHITFSQLSKHAYTNFMESLDCYVLPSKGEGFSITFREALALGIPCILSNNTGHKIACNLGYVRAVPSDIKEPVFYECFKCFCGHNFNCTLKDLRRALRDVYVNYEKYKEQARAGREWVKRYLYSNLKDYYYTLFNPKKVVLCDYNKLEKEILYTSSIQLAQKYRLIKDAKF